MILKLFAGSAAVSAVLGAALWPAGAWAAARDRSAFASGKLAEVLKRLGADQAPESREIVLSARDIAENSALVPVTIESRIPGTNQISIISSANPLPLVATFHFSADVEPYVATRIKMGGTGEVWAVVKAGGKIYTARRQVTITLGACG